MILRLARLLLVVAALAGLAGAAAGQARADTPFFFDSCRTVAPYSTLTLGAGEPSVQSISWYGTYGSGICPRHVVDIVVPTSSSGGPGFLDAFVVGAGPLSGGALGLDTHLACDDYVGYLRVYRKTALGGEFSAIGGGLTHGEWVANGGLLGSYCAIVKDPGFVDLPAFSPPSLATVVYRVAVGARWLGGWRTVRAGAWHLPAF